MPQDASSLKMAQQISATTCTRVPFSFVKSSASLACLDMFGCGFSLVTLQATGQILTLPSNFQAKLSLVFVENSTCSTLLHLAMAG